MSKNFESLKVAIVVDSLASPGGADRLLFSLLSIFPLAKVFTSVYFPENYNKDGWELDVAVNTTFMQKLPFIRDLYRHLGVLSPIAIENLDVRGSDLVISLSAGPAKGVICGIKQPHIGIILTPPRSLWDRENNFSGSAFADLYRVVTPFIKTYLRNWDQTTIYRVDELISISNFIQKKVSHIYKRNSSVIYPGISQFWFEESPSENIPDDIDLNEPFYLVVSRLYDYKRVDMAIKAADKSKRRLLIVGDGPDKFHLQSHAGDTVEFLGWRSDEIVRLLYRKAEALLFCGIEDFGYVPIEAMASGCPVLAYNEGGVTETVVNDVTGKFFRDQLELDSMLEKGLSRSDFDKARIISRAREFTEDRFQKEITQLIEKVLDEN